MLRTRRRRPAFDPLESRRALSGFYVSPAGDDAAAGTIDAPWRTPQHAVAAAAAGDVINLRAGSYAGTLYVDKADLTIRSYPGERASLAAPTSDAIQANVLWFDAPGGTALNLDLSGGYDYGVKFERGRGLVDGCTVTGTGYFGIKVVPGADHVTIRNTEVGHAGVRIDGGGIDAVNGDYLTIRDCYIHDTSTDGLHIKGGSIGVLIERNRVENSGGTGMAIGQSTGTEFFDPAQNPDYYEIIAPVVRNNIIKGTDYAGIAIYAAMQPVVVNNTVIDTARVGQASLYLSPMTHTIGTESRLAVTTDPTIANNIVVRTASGTRPLFHILNDGFTGTLTLDHNRYDNGGGDGGFWDERAGSVFYGTFAAWPAHIGAEAGSSLGPPGLDDRGHLVAGSPCIDAGRSLDVVADDVDRDPRTGAFDIGADESRAVTLSLTGSPLAEAGGVATVTVTLSATSARDITVHLAFAGSAADPADYAGSAATIVVPAGSTSGSITLTAARTAWTRPTSPSSSTSPA